VLVEVCPERVQMLGCGHPHPLRLRGGVVSELHLPEALPLGLGQPAPAVTVDVVPGDRVLLFTDGAVEARRGGRFFPLAEVARDALQLDGLPAALAALGDRLRRYPDGGAPDDVALLAFELPRG